GSLLRCASRSRTGAHVRGGRGMLGQHLAEGRKICLAHPEEAPVPDGRELPVADPALHGALADAQQLGDFVGRIEWPHGRVCGDNDGGVVFHSFSFAWAAPRVMFCPTTIPKNPLPRLGALRPFQKAPESLRASNSVATKRTCA